MTITENEDILQKGCLVHRKCSIWGIKRKIPKGYVHADADQDCIDSTKDLINPDYLKPITRIRDKAGSYLDKKALPFPIDSVKFVIRDMMETIDNAFSGFALEFNNAVAEFTSHYNIYINEMPDRLKGLYNPSDYPSDIEKKFSFQWQYIALGAPSRAQLLSPQVYEREKQKFEQTMLEFRETAVNTLRVSFAKMVDNVVEKLSGEKKRIYDTLTGNVNEFLTDFNALNINNDTELAEQVERCRAILKGVNPDALRSDESLRKHIANNMSNVQKNLDGMMIDRPTRKLRAA